MLYSHGVVGGTFFTTIFFLFFLLSNALSGLSFSSIEFIGRGVISLNSLAASLSEVPVLTDSRKVWYISSTYSE